MSAPDDVRRVFGKFSASGIFFQGGAAAIDNGTIVATLVHGLTGGSAVAVGRCRVRGGSDRRVSRPRRG